MVPYRVVSPRDRVAAAARHHGRGMYHISLAPGKDQNSNFDIQFLPNAYGFCTIRKLENHKSSWHHLYFCGGCREGEGQDWGEGEIEGTLVLYMEVLIFLKENIFMYFLYNIFKRPN